MKFVIFCLAIRKDANRDRLIRVEIHQSQPTIVLRRVASRARLLMKTEGNHRIKWSERQPVYLSIGRIGNELISMSHHKLLELFQHFYTYLVNRWMYSDCLSHRRCWRRTCTRQYRFVGNQLISMFYWIVSFLCWLVSNRLMVQVFQIHHRAD